MAKENKSSHNASAVRQAYEAARTTIMSLLGNDKAKAEKLVEIVKTLSYKTDKETKSHVSGMPAKLWQRALAGVEVAKVMESIFGDANAGMKAARAPLGDKKAPAKANTKAAAAKTTAAAKKKAPAPAKVKAKAKKK